MARLQQGSIVWAVINDEEGRNPKCRPAVVLSHNSRIADREPLVVVAVTGRFELPLPEDTVELPWTSSGHPATGLKKRCVAVCRWFAEVDQSSIESIGGYVPGATMRKIAETMKKLYGS